MYRIMVYFSRSLGSNSFAAKFLACPVSRNTWLTTIAFVYLTPGSQCISSIASSSSLLCLLQSSCSFVPLLSLINLFHYQSAISSFTSDVSGQHFNFHADVSTQESFTLSVFFSAIKVKILKTSIAESTRLSSKSSTAFYFCTASVAISPSSLPHWRIIKAVRIMSDAGRSFSYVSSNLCSEKQGFMEICSIKVSLNLSPILCPNKAQKGEIFGG